VRNIAVAIVVGLVFGAVFGRVFDNTDAASIVIGAAAGASAVLLISAIDRRSSV